MERSSTGSSLALDADNAWVYGQPAGVTSVEDPTATIRSQYEWQSLPKDPDGRASNRHLEGREQEAFTYVTSNCDRFTSMHALFDWYDRKKNRRVEDR